MNASNDTNVTAPSAPPPWAPLCELEESEAFSPAFAITVYIAFGLVGCMLAGASVYVLERKKLKAGPTYSTRTALKALVPLVLLVIGWFLLAQSQTSKTSSCKSETGGLYTWALGFLYVIFGVLGTAIAVFAVWNLEKMRRAGLPYYRGRIINLDQLTSVIVIQRAARGRLGRKEASLREMRRCVLEVAELSDSDDGGGLLLAPLRLRQASHVSGRLPPRAAVVVGPIRGSSALWPSRSARAAEHQHAGEHIFHAGVLDDVLIDDDAP